jgi:chromatin remodeling complex protein RSC6
MEDESVTYTDDATIVESDIETVESTLLKKFDTLINQMEFLFKESKNVHTDLKIMKKKYTKLSKLTKRKKRVVDPNRVKREPSGFVSPILISNELADFLGEERGIQLPRTTVTKRIVNFVKEHNLKDVTNGRMFNLTNDADENAAKLKVLLNIQQGNEVGYFNLQTYLKRHFIKNVPVPVESVSITPIVIDESSVASEKKHKKIKKVNKV